MGHRKLHCSVVDDDGTEPKLRPTANDYTPNSSRKRRVLRTSSVGALRDCSEDIELVGNSKDEWKEIEGLKHALAVETLRTTLLIFLVIVRLGAAWAKHVEEWLGMRGLQKGASQWHKWRDGKRTDSKEDNASEKHFTDGPTDFADRTKLTDVRKRLMSDSEDLLYTTFPQLEASAPLASSTESTTTPLSTSSNNSQAAMSTMLYMPMPPPGTLGSPMFEGANVSEFLERYEDLCSDYRVSEGDKLARLPRYCIQPVAETIKSLKE